MLPDLAITAGFGMAGFDMDLQRLDPDSYGSPYAEQLRRGFHGLRFNALLEKDFREFYVSQNLPRARLSGLIGLVLVLAVTCIDLLLGTGDGTLNTLRLGVLCPLLVVLGVAISVPGAQRWYTEVVAVGVTLVGFVVTYIAHLGALAGSSYVLAGLVIVVLFGCLLLGLLFHVEVAISGMLVPGHCVTRMVIGLP